MPLRLSEVEKILGTLKDAQNGATTQNRAMVELCIRQQIEIDKNKKNTRDLEQTLRANALPDEENSIELLVPKELGPDSTPVIFKGREGDVIKVIVNGEKRVAMVLTAEMVGLLNENLKLGRRLNAYEAAVEEDNQLITMYQDRIHDYLDPEAIEKLIKETEDRRDNILRRNILELVGGSALMRNRLNFRIRHILNQNGLLEPDAGQAFMTRLLKSEPNLNHNDRAMIEFDDMADPFEELSELYNEAPLFDDRGGEDLGVWV